MQRGTKLRYRGGTSYARGQNIDPFLNEEEIKELYSNWPNDWPILTFQGGEKRITCEMIRDLGLEKLAEIFKGNGAYGKRFRERLIKLANYHSVI